ncbi:MAG: hypothetical protein ABIM03_05940 [candidate division WOR-3 bacterium]
MRKGIIFLFLVFFAGCGVKKNPPKVVPPDINEVLKLAWEEYDNFSFSKAYALFDSAIVLDAFNPEGYFGKGWAATQILKLDDAISSFSFALILYNQRFDLPCFKEIIPEDSSSFWGIDSIIGRDTFWHINVRNKPLLSLTSISIKKGTKFVSPEIKDINDESALLRNFAPKTSDNLIDTIFINYYYFSVPQSVDEKVALSYGGLTFSYTGKENYTDAIITGRAVSKAVNSLDFPHPYPVINMTKLKATVAYAAFKMGYMGLCVRILSEIDDQFIPPPNPYDPDRWGEILEELKKFLGA